MEQDAVTPDRAETETPDTDLGCFRKARANGELTFTLRSQDFSAPTVVDFWADVNAGVLGNEHPKIVQARQIAQKMRAWKNRKQAD